MDSYHIRNQTHTPNPNQEEKDHSVIIITTVGYEVRTGEEINPGSRGSTQADP